MSVCVRLRILQNFFLEVCCCFILILPSYRSCYYYACYYYSYILMEFEKTATEPGVYREKQCKIYDISWIFFVLVGFKFILMLSHCGSN